MKNFSKKCISFVVNFGIALSLLLGVVMLNACSKDDEGDNFGVNGFKIVGTSVDSDGAAKISVTGKRQSVSIVFNAKENYTIDVGDCDWISIADGSSPQGEAGHSRSVKLQLVENSGDVIRNAEVYISLGSNPRVKFASVAQGLMPIDDVVKMMDKRLSDEYYWLDKYNRLKDNGKINYDLKGKDWLYDALTGTKWGNINKDDGYMGSNGKWHLFSYLSEYSATKVGPSKSSGFGFELCYTIIAYQNSSEYDFVLEHVYPESPAYEAGFRRGDYITSVNGQKINSSNYSTLFYALQTPSSSTVSVGKKIVSGENTKVETHNLTAGEYYVSPVAYSGLLKEHKELGFDFGAKRIGYISYLTFDGEYDAYLIAALQELANLHITDLIVDLRSNGGGSVYSSAYFASMLLPSSFVGKEMVTLKRNPNNANGDTVVPFFDAVQVDEGRVVDLPHMDLPNIYFITSGSTASASEMLIMSLRAQGINAVTIGTLSTGKDCGMDVTRTRVGSTYYEFAPITFMNKFGDYNVDFSEGIPADVDLDYLATQTSNEEMKKRLEWFPIPEQGGAWGEYTVDLAMGEAVARILGGTIIPVSEGSASFKMAWGDKTRSGEQSVARRVAQMPKPEKMGMFLTEEQRKALPRVENSAE